MKPLLILTLLVSPLFAEATPNSVSLFDGKSLNGWKTCKTQNAKRWSVVDGVITSGDGKNKVKGNTYLCTTKEYGDFEFKCEFRLSGDHKTGLINSGIQYRSQIKNGKIIGYQADIGKGYWGDIYDEHRRNKALVKGNTEELFKTLKEDAWNSYTIRCIGNRHELFINGVKVNEFTELDTNIPAKGIIGIQLHSGGNAKIEFKNVTIKEL
ncbi:DUF1080 domain-containing protein [Verrucomicrobiaceae bacterium N1E253]|uniref:DUF1080 domain-containing protein n=1 Tax=Oceaniferula marina TaxID=2748318 RepID=A0A851GKN7_9BACT|nr:DUF1080 domain-containing protein [Oceaniferula marina]NWK55290.1 DUF1080 domain-containing protein [Oceaniferula marina]